LPTPYRVRAVHCDYRASDDEIYASLGRATAPLTATWEKLSKARRIGIKFNHHWGAHHVVMHEGHRQQLVSDQVARATLRLLRERTKADIFVIDVGVERNLSEDSPETLIQLRDVMAEFGVPFVNGHDEPVDWVDVPGGGQMFDRYPVPRAAREADAIISVQKLKNHSFMGITLCLKNLFGLMPVHSARPRHYYHHLVRMPYMLADLGRIYNPALNIIDGLVCQAGQEWGPGDEPRICNTLLAGDQVIAADACASHLMGHDPQSDWLTEPFHRDRNALLVAAEGGFGTVDLAKIDFASEVQAPVGHFFSKVTDPRETVMSWRKTTAEQGLLYRDHQQKYVDKYRSLYIMLHMGEVVWTSASGQLAVSRRQLSGLHTEQALWFKYVDPDEAEGEHYEVYERVLAVFPRETVISQEV
jgi:hypothetical protein